MRRISAVQERFEADRTEKIVVTVAARNTPYGATFSSDPGGPALSGEQEPPPLDVKSFVMGTSDTSFAIVYRFPPLGSRDPNAHYLVTFSGKNATSDGPNKIKPLSAVNTVSQIYEFRAVATVRVTAKAKPKTRAKARKADPKPKKKPRE